MGSACSFDGACQASSRETCCKASRCSGKHEWHHFASLCVNRTALTSVSSKTSVYLAWATRETESESHVQSLGRRHEFRGKRRARGSWSWCRRTSPCRPERTWSSSSSKRRTLGPLNGSPGRVGTRPTLKSQKLGCFRLRRVHVSGCKIWRKGKLDGCGSKWGDHKMEP